jgi:hypothetical protein
MGAAGKFLRAIGVALGLVIGVFWHPRLIRIGRQVALIAFCWLLGAFAVGVSDW